jgi:hypothetical protein
MVFLLTIISCFLSVPAECPDCPGQKSVPVGPELLIDYAPRGKHTNPVDKFMYFVPLVAPTSVVGFEDPNTTLSAAITTHQILEQPENFKVSCEFEVKGAGVYTAVFDPDQMIAFYTKSAGKSKPIRFMLYSIRMSGPCSGVIEISGLIQRGEKKVENVLVRFNRDGSQSPVFVSMYDVPCIQDRYAYENRYNEQIARINSLCFTRSPGGQGRNGSGGLLGPACQRRGKPAVEHKGDPCQLVFASDADCL